MHQTRKSLIFNKSGNNLTILTNPDNTPDYLISDYITAERIDSIRYNSLKNSYTFEDRSVLIIDSTGIYPKSSSHKILLIQSPKINLDRLIDSIQPKEIIADGSNYKSYIERWETTCIKNKIPFHYTGAKSVILERLTGDINNSPTDNRKYINKRYVKGTKPLSLALPPLNAKT